MTTNVDGVFNCARAAGLHWRRQKKEGTTLDGKKLEGFTYGSFIATASMSGHVVNLPQLQAPYNASKAAVIHLVKSLAVSGGSELLLFPFSSVSGCHREWWESVYP
jgi:sorbose reductase